MKQIFSYIKQIVAIGSIFISLVLFIKIIDHLGFRDVMIAWIAAQGSWAPLAFIMMGMLAYSFAFSANILGTIAYILFGFVQGFILYLILGLLSSFTVFVITRLIFFRHFQTWLKSKPMLLSAQRVIQQKGTVFLCLARFAPVHATLLNAVMALSSIRFKQFVISLVSMIPQWLLFVYFGYCAEQAADAPEGLFSNANIFRYLSIAIFITVLVYGSQQVKQVIDHANSERQNDANNQS